MSQNLDWGFIRTSIEVLLRYWLRYLNSSIKLSTSIEGRKNRELTLLQENQCFSVSSRGVNPTIHDTQLSGVHTNRFITESSFHWDIMHAFWHSYGFFFKLVLKLTLRKLDNNFKAAQRKICRVKYTHPKISLKYTAHTSTCPLQKGIFGFSIFQKIEKIPLRGQICV